MRCSLHCCCLFFSLLASVTYQVHGVAQEPKSSPALFDRGVADMNAGNYAAGCKAIAESQRIDPRPGTLFSLATCHRSLGSRRNSRSALWRVSGAL